jgi:hypothetical protein
MTRSTFRNIGKALCFATACLFAGCLRPFPVSDAEPDSGPEEAFEIDTGLFHLGDSWVYQTKKTVYEFPSRPQSVYRVTAKYIILEKDIKSGRRIDFLMDLQTILENITPMNPDSGKTTETRNTLSYSQSKWGLSTEWQENPPDSTLYFKPGEFLDFRDFESDTRTCLLGGDTLACKFRRMSLIAYAVNEGCQSINLCSHNVPASRSYEALILEGLGLVRAGFQFDYYYPQEESNTRLISKNGIAVPDSIGIEEP